MCRWRQICQGSLIDTDYSLDKHQIETLSKFQVLPPTLEMGTYLIFLVSHTCFRRTSAGNHFELFLTISSSKIQRFLYQSKALLPHI